METIRARVQTKKNIYVHNNLSNAAFYFKTVIEKKLEAGDRNGIAFDGMACAIIMAFTFEANINFLGHKLIDDWEERQPFDVKAQQVFTRLGIEVDWTSRPYSSIKELKRFRDSIAHGKPLEIEHDETIEVPAGELTRRIDLSGEWEKSCKEDAVFRAYEDLETIWKDLLTRSGLSIWETMTTGEGGISLIEKIVAVDNTAAA